MSSFVLDLIDEAIRNNDEELLNKAVAVKNQLFDNVLITQWNLIKGGDFTFLDTESMKVVEARRYLNIITELRDKQNSGGS